MTAPPKSWSVLPSVIWVSEIILAPVWVFQTFTVISNNYSFQVLKSSTFRSTLMLWHWVIQIITRWWWRGACGRVGKGGAKALGLWFFFPSGRPDAVQSPPNPNFRKSENHFLDFQDLRPAMSHFRTFHHPHLDLTDLALVLRFVRNRSFMCFIFNILFPVCCIVFAKCQRSHISKKYCEFERFEPCKSAAIV